MSAPWTNPLEHLSLSQALMIWTELVEAMHGVNKFGGTTAEIYVHRLLPPHAHKPLLQHYAIATQILAELLAMFRREHDVVISTEPLLVNPLAPEDPPPPARHRWHVTVTRREIP